jgi:HEPN domain-containing protein
MNDLTREWVEKAEEDWTVAQRESRARRSPAFGAICFRSQQCAEKYFKARLCEAGRTTTRTHDLPTLLAELIQLDGSLAMLDPAARVLVDYAVKFRYPGERATRAQSRAALNHARLIRQALRRALGLPDTATRVRRRGRRTGARGRAALRK